MISSIIEYDWRCKDLERKQKLRVNRNGLKLMKTASIDMPVLEDANFNLSGYCRENGKKTRIGWTNEIDTFLKLRSSTPASF